MPEPVPIRRQPSEDGYMLLAVIFMLALLLLSLAVAAPRIAKSIQRDREMETMERGKQYIRAIQLYYRKFQSYPPSLDALVKTNNIRFLRKKYIDPLTGKSDWKPIMFGQNKAPLAMGFFGQPLGGVGGAMPVAGIGPSGGNMPQGNGLGAGMGSTMGGSSFGGGMGASPGGIGSSFGGGGMGSSPGGGLFGSTNSGTSPTSGGTSTTGSDNSSGSTSGSGTSGTATNGTGTSGGSGSNGLLGSQGGPAFGGGGIIGVEPVLNKPSILTYKKKSRYNEWEFTYSPLQDMMKQMSAGGAMPAGGGTAQPGTPGFGSSPTGGPASGPGGGLGGTSFGGGSSFGGSSGGFGSTPSQPTQPQQ